MTWLDMVVALGGLGLLALAYKRGIVLEITDLVILVGGGLLGFRLYRPIGSALHRSLLKGFSQNFVEKFVLFVILVVVALVVFGIGLNLQRRIKEDKTLDSRVDSIVGLVIGIPKTILVVVTFLGLMFYNQMFPAAETVKLKKGTVVSTALGMRFVCKPIYYVIAPSDLAKDFIKTGLGPPKKVE